MSDQRLPGMGEWAITSGTAEPRMEVRAPSLGIEARAVKIFLETATIPIRDGDVNRAHLLLPHPQRSAVLGRGSASRGASAAIT